MQSLQSKLGAGLFLSLIITFSMLWLLVSMSARFLAEEYIASRLEHDAETLLSTISFDRDKGLIIGTGRIGLIYQQPFSGHYYVISTETESVSSRSLWDQQLTDTPVDTGGQSRRLQQGPEQQSLLVLTGGYNKQGVNLSVTVAEDLNPIKENIRQFQYWFAALALGMLLLLVVLQAFILRFSLRPLARIQSELKSLEQGQLEKLSTDSPTELRPLINQVNYLLVIMEQRLRRSRDALGDLSHAIKKPLTVIQQLTDKLDIPVATKSTLSKQTGDIFQITDHIMKRARLAGRGHSGTLFSFSEDLPALIQTLDMMYASKILELTIEMADDISCPLDREDMLELLGNLLDNAYKWAVQRIILSVEIDSSLHICIQDDGPGADPEKISELSKRGVRLDEKIKGHGFGLAIAADIVTDYSGKISFKHSDALGGFRTDIRLPIHQ